MDGLADGTAASHGDARGAHVRRPHHHMRPRLPLRHVARARLLARMEAAPVVTIQAAGGYGKTTLLAERLASFDGVGVHVELAPGDGDAWLLALRLSRALRRAGLSDLARAVHTGDDPIDMVDALGDALQAFGDHVLLAIDDVHHATGSAGDALARLVRSLPEHVSVVISARSLPTPLRSLVREGVHLDTDDLAFTPEEAAAFVAVPDGGPTIDELHRRTQGWPAALALSRPGRGFHFGAGIEALVGEHLAVMDADTRALVIQLAHLPVLDDEIAAALGAPDVLDRLQEAGLPLQERGHGRSFLDPVAEVLRELAPADPEIARTVAGMHRARREPLVAARVLIDAGLADQAADLVAGMGPAQAVTQPVADLRAVVDLLPEPVLDGHPGALLHLVRGLELTFERSASDELLDRLVALVGDRPTTPIARGVLAEVARAAVRRLEMAEGARIAREVLDACEAGEDAVRARALDALAWTLAWESADYAEAERLLQAAVAAARRAGVELWAAEALLTLAARVQHKSGALDRAEASLRQALSMYPRRSPRSATVLAFLSDVLADAGRTEEAALLASEGYAIGVSLASQQGAGYCAWSLARSVSAMGDATRTVEALANVERHRGDWFGISTGPTFLGEAAGLLERVGESDLADHYMARAAERRDEAPWWVALGEVALAVRRGRPEAETLLEAAMALDGWTPLDRLRLETLGASLALHRGAPDAGERASALFDRAALMGQPTLPLVSEPDLGEALLDAAVSHGSAAARSAADALPITVSVLGGFTIHRGGRPVDVPAGTAEELVKLLAARDSLTQQDAVAWLDTSGPVATRQWLHTALDVLGRVAPGLVTNEGERLRFADGVFVDAHQFARDAATARRLASRDRRGAVHAARTAVARYAGDLLPGDAAAWVTERRVQLQSEYLAAEDLLVDAAIDEGDVDDAIAAVQRAVRVDASDEDRHVRLAELYLRQGRRSRATTALEAARSAAAQVGVPTSARYRSALAALHADTGHVEVASPAGRAFTGSEAGSDTPARWTVRVLGSFEVDEGGRSLQLPPGRPTRLVGLLVASGGPLTVPEVIDVLWPDVDERTGRARLRETLHRLRRHAALVERAGEDQLALAPGVSSDLAAFEAAAAAAESGGVDAVTAAQTAVGYYRGPLLGDEPSGDWVLSRRERVRLRVLGLLDLMVADARRRGSADEAIRLAERAIEVDPLDEVRAAEAASLLIMGRQRARARTLVVKVRDAMAAHDLELGEALRAVADQLGVEPPEPPGVRRGARVRP